MKKLLMIACAVALCLSCAGLAACGGGSSASGASNSSAAEDPAAKFVGEWELAAAEGGGITFAGNFATLVGSEDKVVLALSEDGTGSLAIDENSVNLSWEASGENTIEMTADSSFTDLGLGGGKVSADKKSVVVEGTYKDEMIALDLGEADYANNMIFTRDGTIPTLPALTTEAAEAITAGETLVGNWSLSGVNMNGMLLYGDADNLSALVGDQDVSLTIGEDGSVAFMGANGTYNLGDDGATLVLDEAVVAVKKIEDDLIIEFSEDDAGIPMIMRFTKQ